MKTNLFKKNFPFDDMMSSSKQHIASQLKKRLISVGLTKATKRSTGASSAIVSTESVDVNPIEMYYDDYSDDYAGETQAFMYTFVKISSSSSAAALSNGAIAGIVIGSFAAVTLIVIAILVATGVIGGGICLGRAVTTSGKNDVELYVNPAVNRSSV